MSKPKVELTTLAGAEETYRFAGERSDTDVDWCDPFLDDGLGPLKIGDIVVFAGRKGTGKSMSLLRQLLHLDVPSLYCSCEDPMREVGRRVSASPFPYEAKERVKLYVPEMPRLSMVVAAMSTSGARVVGVDYLQIVQDDTGLSTFDRMGQIRNILTTLRATAKKNGQSVILNAQLKRPPQAPRDDDEGDLDKPRDREPRGTSYDIRDSSDVENVADGIVLIHRIGRKKFDQTIDKAKSRIGGTRRKFFRGPGGFPVESDPEALTESRSYDTYSNKEAEEPPPF